MKKVILYPKIIFTVIVLLSSLIPFNAFSTPRNQSNTKVNVSPRPQPPAPHAWGVYSEQGSDMPAADYANLYVIPLSRNPDECPNDDPAKLVNPTVRVSFRVIKEGGIGDVIVRCIALDDTIFLSKSDLIFDRWGPKGSELAQFNSFQITNGTLEGTIGFGAGLAFAFRQIKTKVNPNYEPDLDASEQPDALENDAIVESHYKISFKSDCKYESNNPLCPSYKISETGENYIFGETVDAYGEVFVEGDNIPLYHIDKSSISDLFFHKPNNGVFKIFLFSL